MCELQVNISNYYWNKEPLCAMAGYKGEWDYSVSCYHSTL